MDIAVVLQGVWEVLEEACLFEGPSCPVAEAGLQDRPSCCGEDNVGRIQGSPSACSSDNPTERWGRGRSQAGPSSCQDGTAGRRSWAGRRTEASAGWVGLRRGPFCCTSCAAGDPWTAAAVRGSRREGAGLRVQAAWEAWSQAGRGQAPQARAQHWEPALPAARTLSCCCFVVVAAAARMRRRLFPLRATLTATRMTLLETASGARCSRARSYSLLLLLLLLLLPPLLPVWRLGSSGWTLPRRRTEHLAWNWWSENIRERWIRITNVIPVHNIIKKKFLLQK